MLSAASLNICFTLTLGGVGGLAFYFLGAPAPFMLGSMLVCWCVGALIRRTRPYLSIPWPLRFGVISIVAVVLGSYATPDAIQGMLSWWPSLLALAIASLLVTWLSYFFLRSRGYDDVVAWLSAQPAGLSEIVTMATRYTDKDYLVAFFHLVRVSTVFLFVPLLVWFVASDFDTQVLPQGQVRSWQVDWWIWPQFALIALFGSLIGRVARLPMSVLLGPMLLTAVLSGMGFLEWQRPFELICLVQVVLGASIGGRMGQVEFRTLWSAVPDAYLNAFGIIFVSFAVALGIALLIDEEVLKIFLAFSPGGVTELSLIAVALGYEVAFITLHHLFRMAVVMFAMPLKALPAPKNARPPG